MEKKTFFGSSHYLVRQPRGVSLAGSLPIFIPIIVLSTLNHARNQISAGSGVVGVAMVRG